MGRMSKLGGGEGEESVHSVEMRDLKCYLVQVQGNLLVIVVRLRLIMQVHLV